MAAAQFGALLSCPACHSKVDATTFWIAQLRAAKIFLRPKVANRAMGRCDCCGCVVADGERG